MENAIVVKGIKKTFGKGGSQTQVLKGVDFEIQKGEFVALMGASGSGKSTLLYLIGGLDKEYEGEILLQGQKISGMKEKEMEKFRLQKLGFVFQFYNLVQNLSVEDNIMLPIVMAGKDTKEAREKLEEILEITGLKEKRRSKPNQLSGGQQQRVAVARAVLGNPEIILADEPTGNLDKASGKEVMDLFKRINEEKGITILMVTHSNECAAYASRTIVLESGKVKTSEGEEESI